MQLRKECEGWSLRSKVIQKKNRDRFDYIPAKNTMKKYTQIRIIFHLFESTTFHHARVIGVSKECIMHDHEI